MIHGTENRYVNGGCRCPACRRAASRARKIRRLITRDQETPLMVDAIGTRRRLQALMTQGWSMPRLAKLAGVADETFVNIYKPREYRRVSRTTAELVSRIYDELWDTEPTCETQAERHGFSYSKAIASRNGFVPPMAWAGIDIDDPNARPRLDADESGVIDWVAIERALDGVEVSLTRDERRAAVRAFKRAGMTKTQISKRLRMSGESVRKFWEEELQPTG